MPIGKEASSYRGAYKVPLCVCVTFVFFTDCDSCTRPISTHPVSMEAGEYGLTLGTCFSRAVSRWSRSPGCCGFRGVFWVGRIFFVFFFLRTHTACCKYEAASCLIYLSTSNEARPRERSDRCRFLPLKTTSSYLGAYRVPLFN